MPCWHRCNSRIANTSHSQTAKAVGDFYESHPYPPPVDDLDTYRASWDDRRRRADSHLFWPNQPFRADRSILVAGCGTAQAARYAMRWPHARVVGIDVSATSVAFTQELKHKYALDNLEVRQLALERVRELGESFDHVVCTGVLHHLADPDAGLQALRDVLAPDGAMHLMVYAPYGRAGVYMLQDYCRRLGVGSTDAEIRDLAATLKALPPDHPIAPLLRASPDFASRTGLADALLHPNDRAYSVLQLLELIENAGLRFGRWMRQAPYLPYCGAIASTPHCSLLAALPRDAQYVAMELFRGTMVRHSVILYRRDSRASGSRVSFEGDHWHDYVPIRLPDTIAVRDGLPPGATAVLINRSHTYTDLYLPITAAQDRLLNAIDGARSIARIADADRERVRAFFEQLWRWDQIVFDISDQSQPTVA
jgi:SAM-dependent methyltransferase